MYLSDTPALCALEILVHADASQLRASYVLIPLDAPDDVSRTMVDVAKLPPDWRDSPAPPALQVLGDAWLAAGATALLAVPSAIAPPQLNFVLNPAHPDARRCVTGASQAWRFDPRLKR